MTDERRAKWEIGGLDETPSIDSTGWRRPQSVAIEGGDLVFRWPADLVRLADAWRAGHSATYSYEEWRDRRRRLMAQPPEQVRPSRALLLRFAQLPTRSDSEIRAFAARYGALQEQVSDHPDWVAPPLLPDRQSLDYWRRLSASFARALDLAAPPERTFAQEGDLLYLVNGHLFQANVVDFVTFELGQPRVLHASGGLYGGLATQLLAAVARRGLRLCQGCGAEVEPGGRLFCETCRTARVPARLRQRRRRFRVSADHAVREAASVES